MDSQRRDHGEVMNALRRMMFRVIVLGACLTAAGLLSSQPSRAQAEHGLTPEYVIIDRTDSEADVVRKAASVVPAPRQLSWQRQELTAFVHFGMNTFTVQEWGSGSAHGGLRARLIVPCFRSRYASGNMSSDSGWNNGMGVCGRRSPAGEPSEKSDYCVFPS